MVLSCRRLYLPGDLYQVMNEEDEEDKTAAPAFRKNHSRIRHHIERFGKNILITDHKD